MSFDLRDVWNMIISFSCLIFFFLSFLPKLESRADAGYPDAQCCLAYLLEQGEGVTKDIDRAIELYRKASEKGHVVATYNLGLLHVHRGDMRVAGEVLSRAASAGSDEAMNFLGTLLLEGRQGLPSDESRAVDLLVASAKAGNARAANNVGVLCASGRAGMPMNANIAKQWFAKAKGVEESPVNLKLLAAQEKARRAEEKEAKLPSRPTKKARPNAKKKTDDTAADNGAAVAPATGIPSGEADLAKIEAMANHIFHIYDVKRKGSLDKEEFVLCWTELPMLEEDFAGQDIPEESLASAFEALTRGEPELPLAGFIAFFLKATKRERRVVAVFVS